MSPWPRDRPSASAQPEPVSNLPELLIRELRVGGPLYLAMLDDPSDGFHMPKGREATFGHIAAQPSGFLASSRSSGWLSTPRPMRLGTASRKEFLR